MTQYIRPLLVLIALLACSTSAVYAQTSNDATKQELAKVFVIGDYQEQYEALFTTYPDILIMVCQNNIDSAHGRWLDYTADMEAYSKEVGFDLEGVSMWIHFFWNETGGIDHVAYHLQPHSKFVKDDLMQAFLLAFARSSRIDVTAMRGFNHYGSVSFPLFYHEQR